MVRKNGGAVEDECKWIQSCLLSKTSINVIEYSVIIGVLDDFHESSSNNKKIIFSILLFKKSRQNVTLSQIF